MPLRERAIATCQGCCGNRASRKPEQRGMADGASRYQHVQEGARNGNGGEHTDQHTQEKRGGESNDDARTEIAAKVVQYSAGDQCRNVRVPDRRPCALPSDIYGGSKQSPCA